MRESIDKESMYRPYLNEPYLNLGVAIVRQAADDLRELYRKDLYVCYSCPSRIYRDDIEDFFLSNRFRQFMNCDYDGEYFIKEIKKMSEINIVQESKPEVKQKRKYTRRAKTEQNVPKVELAVEKTAVEEKSAVDTSAVCEPMTQEDRQYIKDMMLNKPKPQFDNVPNHYAGKTQPIDLIMAQGLSFCLGNVVKYVCRAGKKEGESREKDLSKALDYLNMELAYED